MPFAENVLDGSFFFFPPSQRAAGSFSIFFFWTMSQRALSLSSLLANDPRFASFFFWPDKEIEPSLA